MLSYKNQGLDLEEYVSRMNGIKEAIERVSGGGFNYDYEFQTDGKHILALTHYDFMDEYGSYDAVIAFQIVVNIETANFKVDITSQNTPHAKEVYEQEDLGSFFGDTYAMALEKLIGNPIVPYTIEQTVYSA